jgi:hypothetical protein
MSTTRRNVYKLFYLTMLPMGLVALVLQWFPSLPLMVYVGLLVGIPTVITLGLWNRMGEMELTQILTTRKDGPS